MTSQQDALHTSNALRTPTLSTVQNRGHMQSDSRAAINTTPLSLCGDKLCSKHSACCSGKSVCSMGKTGLQTGRLKIALNKQPRSTAVLTCSASPSLPCHSALDLSM